MLSQQIRDGLPADLVYKVMEYACYKTHDTAKMIKQAVKANTITNDWRLQSAPLIFYSDYIVDGMLCDDDVNVIDYIEKDCAEMRRDVELYILHPSDWFSILTEEYAECDEETREQLILFHQTLLPQDCLHSLLVGSKKQRIQAWDYYKRLSDCPTWDGGIDIGSPIAV